MTSTLSEKQKQLRRALRTLGVGVYSSYTPEVRFLASILEEGEEVLGAVFGRYSHPTEHLSGHGALVATNYRILLLDRKPLFTRYEELGYAIVSGVTLTSSGLFASVTLETRAGDITIAAYSEKPAVVFARAIEEKAIKEEHTPEELDNKYNWPAL